MIEEELEKLMKDIYEQGHICGINNDSWFKAYAVAAKKIMKGAKFSDDLVSID